MSCLETTTPLCPRSRHSALSMQPNVENQGLGCFFFPKTRKKKGFKQAPSWQAPYFLQCGEGLSSGVDSIPMGHGTGQGPPRPQLRLGGHMGVLRQAELHCGAGHGSQNQPHVAVQPGEPGWWGRTEGAGNLLQSPSRKKHPGGFLRVHWEGKVEF